jgi:formyl-CoA transferase
MTQPPLSGIKVIDFTGVQAGPACTQMLAWFGADVLKVERVTGGDVTRHQLRDIPDVDALYFTMLNSNKRSLAINTKTPEGKEVMEKLIRDADVLVENFAPGAMDRMGLSWEHIHELNPRLIFGSVKGFNDDSPWSDLKVYENVAQCAGGAASTTGFWDGPPTVSAAALGDSNSGMHLLIGLLTALLAREKTGVGQKVSVSMQDAVLNLCRVKLRDQERLERVGYLEEYPQYPNGTFTDTVPRGGNAGGGGTPTSTSPSRNRTGRAHARRSVGRSGSTTRRTTPRRPVNRSSSTSSARSKSGWPTRPNTRRSTSCASSRYPAHRCFP